ncbi:S66 peptidase family protein [Kushneria aurantia]|uniref:LD-carboxypeptidase n=1 Tax=Kushneria aurantia TaxID=504092 RepID=A0ABV6G846_9GAMM|nr:LD-carboxypeptidase [Kushneria aurantia]
MDEKYPLGRLQGPLALCAPASALREGDPQATCEALRALGYQPLVTDNASARHRYLAGTVAQRVDDLYQAFNIDEVAAVWCLRGGYGAAQLIEAVDWSRLPEAPLLGYSDISVLLSAFHRRGRDAIHAPVASELLKIEHASNAEEMRLRQQSMNAIADVLNGRSGEMAAQYFSGPQKVVEGEMIGGNLTTLASLAGTSAALYVPERSLLLLEDVGEAPYRLERSLCQLLGSLPTERLTAVCLGSFIGCGEQGEAVIAEVAAEWLAPRQIPLYHRLPFGHGALNMPWPVGRWARVGEERLTWARRPAGPCGALR